MFDYPASCEECAWLLVIVQEYKSLVLRYRISRHFGTVKICLNQVASLSLGQMLRFLEFKLTILKYRYFIRSWSHLPS
jgi:hypothetical protein